MTVNQFFSAGRTIGNSSEQDLIEALTVESIQIYGLEMLYIPRNLNKFDHLFLEDVLSSFTHYYPIEMYLENVNGFEGDDMMSKFGFAFNSSASLLVSKRRWQEAVGQSGNTLLPNRPCEGDLLYFPLTKSVLEIKKADIFNEFYQVGKLYSYRLTVELFQYSSETIETGNTDIDDIRFPFNHMDEESYGVLGEDGTSILDEGGLIIVSDDYTMDNVDVLSDNDYVQQANDTLLDFDANNPFGNVVD